MPKRKRMKHSREHTEAVREFIEWQEKQYVSGFWAGQKIPQFLTVHLKGTLSLLVGYVLLGTGSLSLLILLLAVAVRLLRQGPAALGNTQNLVVPALLFVLLQIAAGVSLARRRRT